MKPGRRSRAIPICITACVALFTTVAMSAPFRQASMRFLNSTGILETVTSPVEKKLDVTNPFFQSLGTNGRTCASCHQPSDGLSITPTHLRMRFAASGGTDPVFRPNDGSVCPTADVSTLQAKRNAYSLLLERGLIRVSMPIPANADYYLESVEDPYNCATAADLSLYRRPLPSTNLKFLSGLMWDGREPSLATQAINATTGHAQGAPPTAEQVQQIVDFESSLFTAQSVDFFAGALDSHKANGGPQAVAKQPFHIGINDPLGGNPTGEAFNPNVFTIFDAWNKDRNPRRASIARGQAIFNTHPISITGVKGLNDALNAPAIQGTCTVCHDTPNVGNHSVSLPIDIGVSSFDSDGTELAYLPKYHFRCNSGEEVVTTDPGRGLITGKCADIGKFKGPILRGLSARPPYFHNGRARTLADVVDFYNQRFSMKLSARERADLIAFLEAL